MCVKKEKCVERERFTDSHATRLRPFKRGRPNFLEQGISNHHKVSCIRTNNPRALAAFNSALSEVVLILFSEPDRRTDSPKLEQIAPIENPIENELATNDSPPHLCSNFSVAPKLEMKQIERNPTAQKQLKCFAGKVNFNSNNPLLRAQVGSSRPGK